MVVVLVVVLVLVLVLLLLLLLVVVVVVLRVVMLCVRVFLDGNQSNCGYLKFQEICCFSPNEVWGYF